MIINKKIFLFIFTTVFLLGFLAACNQSGKSDEKEPQTRTPVTIINVSHEQLAETIDLNATSVFQIKDNVKANLNGYIEDVHAKLGDIVKKGQLLFTLKTKEAAALSMKTIDSSFNFSGKIKVYSPLSGVITELNKQSGDYVQEGDDIAVVAEQNSLVFILEVPYELREYVKTGSSCDIALPDKEVIKGLIYSEMPTVDAVSQTQSYVVKPIANSMLPENLIAKIDIVKSIKDKAQTLPKAAVLTDESQSEWWVMKLINDSMAIKVPIKKGIEASGKVEIIEPEFNEKDRIILTGNYGLPDTAGVSISKER